MELDSSFLVQTIVRIVVTRTYGSRLLQSSLFFTWTTEIYAKKKKEIERDVANIETKEAT